MGLITKEVTVKWNAFTKKYYEEKGYIFTKYKDDIIVKVNDLLPKSGEKVDVLCDDCGCLLNITYACYNTYLRNGKYYCNLCSVKLYGTENSRLTKLKKSMSFEEWCVNNLSKEDLQAILLKWDYEKNKCKPSEISYQSDGVEGRGYWFKCIENSEHVSERKILSDFVKNRKNILTCHQCDSVYYKYPEFAKHFVNIDDAKKYSSNSSFKVDIRCPDCGFIKHMCISQCFDHGFACPVCSDGVSYPNKFAFELLTQLKIKFINEFAPEWANRKRYDFYFEKDDIKYILEMDGEWHFKDNRQSGQSKEKSHQIDIEKEKLAEQNNIDLFRVTCIISDLNCLKTGITESKLNNLFDLSQINWEECAKKASRSLMILACKLWDKCYDINEVSKQVGMSLITVNRYLRKGGAIGLCSYNGQEEKTKKIICLNNKKVFKNSTEAALFYCFPLSGDKYNWKITKSIKNKDGCYGIDPKTGEVLYWMYYKDWLRKNQQNDIQTAI